MRRPQSSVGQTSVRNGNQTRCSIRARKWHAEPQSRTAHTWVGYAADTRNVVKGCTATSGGGAALELVMPLAKTALGRERMARSARDNSSAAVKCFVSGLGCAGKATHLGECREVGRKERRRAATGLYRGDDASASLRIAAMYQHARRLARAWK